MRLSWQSPPLAVDISVSQTATMHFSALLALLGSLAASTAAQRYDGQFWPCNPTKNATGACPPSPGLPNSTYFIDFTKVTSIPPEWTLSNWAQLKFGPLGAEFTFNKRYDAPQLWTDFMILFGKVTIEARVANGTAMISSAVLMSDTFDEIDYEFSGNNFGQERWAAGIGQNNYFGKVISIASLMMAGHIADLYQGVTGNYDRGEYFPVSKPQSTFHKYTIDWSPTALSWAVDGKNIRTHLASKSTPKGAYQYPQSPSKLQLGIWCAGDPSANSGTRDWAGGYTDLEGGPYTMYIKSVTIENRYPAYGYNYTDQSGSFSSIQLLKKPFIDDIAQPNGDDKPEDGPNDADDGDDKDEVKPTTIKTSTTSSKAASAPSTSVKPSTMVTTAKPSTSSTLKTTAKPTTIIKATVKPSAKSSSTCTTTTKKPATTAAKKSATTVAKRPAATTAAKGPTAPTAAPKQGSRWVYYSKNWWYWSDGKKWVLPPAPTAKPGPSRFTKWLGKYWYWTGKKWYLWGNPL